MRITPPVPAANNLSTLRLKRFMARALATLLSSQ
jgi:hypothetical protein